MLILTIGIFVIFFYGVIRFYDGLTRDLYRRINEDKDRFKP